MSGTEGLEPAYAGLDTLPGEAVLDLLVGSQARAAEAVRRALPALGAAVAAAVPRLERGGRLVYVGAGTSGRLGALDAAELPPTFSWPRERAVALLAGGPRAMTEAIEGAEDEAGAGEADLLALAPTPDDVVLAVAASGGTPYAIAAARAARARGALTVGLANNPGAGLLEAAEHPVLLETGPEVVSGSTRLCAGTAQKIALNAFSTAAMVGLGKVYGNLMVDLKATNAKLRRRAVRLAVAATGAGEDEAQAALLAAGWSVKTAIVMLRLRLGSQEAEARLAAVGGRTRAALGGEGPPL